MKAIANSGTAISPRMNIKKKGLTQGRQGGQGQTQGTTDLTTPTQVAREAMQPTPTTETGGSRPNGPIQGPQPPKGAP